MDFTQSLIRLPGNMLCLALLFSQHNTSRSIVNHIQVYDWLVRITSHITIHTISSTQTVDFSRVSQQKQISVLFILILIPVVPLIQLWFIYQSIRLSYPYFILLFICIVYSKNQFHFKSNVKFYITMNIYNLLRTLIVHRSIWIVLSWIKMINEITSIHYFVQHQSMLHDNYQALNPKKMHFISKVISVHLINRSWISSVPFLFVCSRDQYFNCYRPLYRVLCFRLVCSYTLCRLDGRHILEIKNL